MELTKIYTDGCCEPNPGKGGWGFVVVSRCESIEIDCGYGIVENTTNNKMEMIGVIKALEYCLDRNIKNVLICSDSKYTINTFSKVWKAKKNLDLIEKAMMLQKKIKVKYKWVRGHNGNRWNERADFLAMV